MAEAKHRIPDAEIPSILHLLIYRSEGAWHAHCLDFDLVEEGDSKEEALQEVSRVVRHFLEDVTENMNLEALKHKAPRELWDCFAKARRLPGTITIRFRSRPVAPSRARRRLLRPSIPALAYLSLSPLRATC